jgi:hypothetical protein
MASNDTYAPDVKPPVESGDVSTPPCGGAARPPARRPNFGELPPWYCPHTGRILSTKGLTVDSPAPVRRSKIRVYPDGIMYTAASISRKAPEGDRGEIKGFSSAAAKRLRQWCLTMQGDPAFTPYALTLTCRQRLDAAQWRSAVKRFRLTLREKAPLWAALWRVELQRRKVPHLHCVFWVPPVLCILGQWHETNQGLAWFTIRQWWLAAIREDDDPASRNHAVHCRQLDDAAGWTIYMALHNSKQQGAQLGWIGKQWGVWNRDAWFPREAAIDCEFSEADAVRLLRVFRRWRKAKNGTRPRWGNARNSFDLLTGKATFRLLRIFEGSESDPKTNQPKATNESKS